MTVPHEETKAKKEARRAEWNRYVQERVQSPLRPVASLLPETLNSALIIVPGSSGDVILATTIIRYIKERNPQCHVCYAVKNANLPLARLCPGADRVIEWPKPSPANPRSRRLSLMKCAGQADAILYPICDPEDMDLLVRYHFLETMWLLSGIPDGVPAEPQPLWIVPPNNADAAARGVLERCLGGSHARQLLAEVGRQPGKPFVRALRERKIKAAGWKMIPHAMLRLLRNAEYLRHLPRSLPLSEAAARLVIVSSEANMFPRPPRGLFEAIIRFFRAQGRIVLQNVLDPAHAVPGAVPLVCSYDEFLSLRAAGVPFVGWRSGLCDIAAALPAPMCTIYPSTFAGCGDMIRATMESPIQSFGFASMNVADHGMELVCDSVADLDYGALGSLLRQ